MDMDGVLSFIADEAQLRFGNNEPANGHDQIRRAIGEFCESIEDLTDIRENVPAASWHHLWAFRRLYKYVEYKARERGVEPV